MMVSQVDGGFKGMDATITERMVEGARAIVEAAKRKPSLDVSNCELDGTKGDGESVSQMLRTFPALKSLNMRDNPKMFSEGIKPIAAVPDEDRTSLAMGLSPIIWIWICRGTILAAVPDGW